MKGAWNLECCHDDQNYIKKRFYFPRNLLFAEFQLIRIDISTCRVLVKLITH